MSLTAVLVLVLLHTVLSVDASGWSYKGAHGPKHWAQTYPDCGGDRQSPIDLSKTKGVCQPTLTWTGYDDMPDTMDINNNGHSVVLTSTGVTPRITFDDGRIYQLDNVHFHWGKGGKDGSEHTLEGRRFTMEMHGVHKRVDDNGTAADPADFIVITYLFQASSAGTNGLDLFVDDLNDVVKADTGTSIDPFPWSKLLPRFTEDFNWYEGSLTTPPCSEVVTFFINLRIGNVTKNQMLPFRQLLNDKNKKMSRNVRPLQKRHGRDIYYHG